MEIANPMIATSSSEEKSFKTAFLKTSVENSVFRGMKISLMTFTPRLDYKEGLFSTRIIKQKLVVQKVMSFLNLEENWNTYGALPFKFDLVQKVVEIIHKLNYVPEVFPTGRQSIQLEFENQNTDYLEFEIFVDRIVCYHEINGVDNTNVIGLEEIETIVNTFYAESAI
jgi:hypothetical protein